MQARTKEGSSISSALFSVGEQNIFNEFATLAMFQIYQTIVASKNIKEAASALKASVRSLRLMLRELATDYDQLKKLGAFEFLQHFPYCMVAIQHPMKLDDYSLRQIHFIICETLDLNSAARRLRCPALTLQTYLEKHTTSYDEIRGFTSIHAASVFKYYDLVGAIALMEEETTSLKRPRNIFESLIEMPQPAAKKAKLITPVDTSSPDQSDDQADMRLTHQTPVIEALPNFFDSTDGIQETEFLAIPEFPLPELPETGQLLARSQSDLFASPPASPSKVRFNYNFGLVDEDAMDRLGIDHYPEDWSLYDLNA